MFALFLQEKKKTTRQFSLYNCHSPGQPLKMWLIFLSENSAISSMFLCNIFCQLRIFFFFLENSFNMNFLWLFFSHLSYTKHVRPERYPLWWLALREPSASHTKETQSPNS